MAMMMSIQRGVVLSKEGLSVSIPVGLGGWADESGSLTEQYNGDGDENHEDMVVS